jgi:hypothetical protein
MQKKIAAFALTGAVVLGGGAAIAIPAMADSSGSSTSTSSAPDAQTGRLDAIKNALKGLVEDKTLTQAQADKVASALSQPGALGPLGGGHRGPGGMGGPGFGGPGFRGPGFGGLQAGLDAAAKALGMSAADVRTALQGGSTLADLAKKQGKDETAVVNALVDAAKTQLADAVKAGRLTQARSDEIAKDLPARIKDFVDNGGPKLGMRGPDGMRGGMRGGPGGGPGFGPGATPGATPSPGATGSSTSWTGAGASSTI